MLLASIFLFPVLCRLSVALNRGCELVGQSSESHGDPGCWSGSFTFESCCVDTHGIGGNPACWDGLHTFDSCCCRPPAPKLLGEKIRQTTSDSQHQYNENADTQHQYNENVESADVDERLMMRFATCLGRIPKKDAYAAAHELRYKMTFEFLLKTFPQLINQTTSVSPLAILNLGGDGLLTDPFPFCVAEVFNTVQAQVHVKVDSYASDLRRPFSRIPDNAYDLVLCLEVIEHVGDLSPAEVGEDPSSFNQLWKGSGMMNMLHETRRVLRRQGRLLLTTPNAASYMVFANAIKHMPPMFFSPHIRELTVKSLGELLMKSCLGWGTLAYDMDFKFSGRDFLLEDAVMNLIEQVDFYNQRRDPSFRLFRKMALLVLTGKSSLNACKEFNLHRNPFGTNDEPVHFMVDSYFRVAPKLVAGPSSLLKHGSDARATNQ